jgi:hypothetical protein
MVLVLVTLLVSSSGVVLVSAVSSQLYALVSDNRCLFINASLSTTIVKNELHCSALCNINSNCDMFMYVSTSKVCALYAGMRKTIYTEKSFSSPGTCRIFNSGWASVSNFDVIYQIRIKLLSSKPLIFGCTKFDLMHLSLRYTVSRNALKSAWSNRKDRAKKQATTS